MKKMKEPKGLNIVWEVVEVGFLADLPVVEAVMAPEMVNLQVEELEGICKDMEEGLVPLQQQIREVFHRIVRSRIEFLDLMDQAAKLSAPTV